MLTTSYCCSITSRHSGRPIVSFLYPFHRFSARLPGRWRRRCHLHKYKGGPRTQPSTVFNLCRIGLHTYERVLPADLWAARGYSKLQTVDLACMLSVFLPCSLLDVLCSRFLGIPFDSICILGFHGLKCADLRQSALRLHCSLGARTCSVDLRNGCVLGRWIQFTICAIRRTFRVSKK